MRMLDKKYLQNNVTFNFFSLLEYMNIVTKLINTDYM